MPRRILILVTALYLFGGTMAWGGSIRGCFTSILLLQRKELVSILNQSDADSLSRVYSAIPTPDRAVSFLYFSRMLELRPSGFVEKGFLDNLPQTPTEFGYLYGFTYRPLGDDRLDSLLSHAWDATYERATKLVLKHRSYVQRYFRFAAVLDGEALEGMVGSPCMLVKADCLWFFRSLEAAHPSVQDVILVLISEGDFDTDCIRAHRKHIAPRFLEALGIH